MFENIIMFVVASIRFFATNRPFLPQMQKEKYYYNNYNSFLRFAKRKTVIFHEFSENIFSRIKKGKAKKNA